MPLDRITSEVSRRIQELLGGSLRDIILFGSYARGDYDNESDIDIMVLADIKESEIYKTEREINWACDDLSLDNNIMICILLNNKTLFEKRMPISPFYRNVINDGVQIYAN